MVEHVPIWKFEAEWQLLDQDDFLEYYITHRGMAKTKALWLWDFLRMDDGIMKHVKANGKIALWQCVNSQWVQAENKASETHKTAYERFPLQA